MVSIEGPQTGVKKVNLKRSIVQNSFNKKISNPLAAVYNKRKASENEVSYIIEHKYIYYDNMKFFHIQYTIYTIQVYSTENSCLLKKKKEKVSKENRTRQIYKMSYKKKTRKCHCSMLL